MVPHILSILMPKNINPFAGKKVLGSNNSKKAPKREKKAKAKGKQSHTVQYYTLAKLYSHRSYIRRRRYLSQKALQGSSAMTQVSLQPWEHGGIWAAHDTHDCRAQTEAERLFMGPCRHCGQRCSSMAVWRMADRAEQSKEIPQ